MENKIKDILKKLGADECKIANLDRFEDAHDGFKPTDLYNECKSVIVFIKRLPKGLAYVNPRIIYNKYVDINVEEIDKIAYKGSLEIEKEFNMIAIPIPSDSPYEYWNENEKEGKGILSMRHAAKLSGIGSMGKNTLIINKEYGNMINIGAILTNINLKSDEFAEKICVEECRKCVDNCPSKALDGTSVIQKLCREHTYGVNKRGFSIVNCNKCRMICPMVFGKK